MLAAHTHRAPEALGHVEHSEHHTGLPGTPGDQPAADGLPGTRRGSASGSEQEEQGAAQGVTCIHVGGLENEVNGLEDEDKLCKVFSRFGTVLEATMRFRREGSGKSKKVSWALISFAAGAEAQRALDGTEALAVQYEGLVTRSVDELQVLQSTGSMGEVMRKHVAARGQKLLEGPKGVTDEELEDDLRRLLNLMDHAEEAVEIQQEALRGKKKKHKKVGPPTCSGGWWGADKKRPITLAVVNNVFLIFAGFFLSALLYQIDVGADSRTLSVRGVRAEGLHVHTAAAVRLRSGTGATSATVRAPPQQVAAVRLGESSLGSRGAGLALEPGGDGWAGGDEADCATDGATVDGGEGEDRRRVTR